MGIKANLIVGEPGGRYGTLDQPLPVLESGLRGAIESIEGPNEFDTAGDQDWPTKVRDYQRRLYLRVKSSAALAGVPVVGPSLVRSGRWDLLGDVSSFLDYGVHLYPDGRQPSENITAELSRTAKNSGTKPIFATETGYHNALAWSGGHLPTSERAAGIYFPRLYLEYFRRDVTRTYAYEFVDEWPDPT